VNTVRLVEFVKDAPGWQFVLHESYVISVHFPQAEKQNVPETI